MSEQTVTKGITAAVADAVRQVAKDQNLPIPERIDSSTRLFGSDGLFDSLALVTLVVYVERTIQDTFHAGITLADDRAMSQESSPFLTVGSLAEYARKLVEEQKSG